MKYFLACFIALLPAFRMRAQGYVDQKAVAPLLETQSSIPATGQVGWHIYTFPAKAKTATSRLAALKKHLQSLPGQMTDHRMETVVLSNRATTKYFAQKKTLFVPDSFVADFRAYSPYPLHWPGADTTPQVFVIDKFTQTFAAYDHGQLMRWGLVSTGSDASETPGGRFAFGWKAQERNSTAAPEGEVWTLRWVYNFYPARGIHVHQYSLPIAQNVSHGCVRMTETDAHWNYDWAQKGATVLVLGSLPYGLAAHWRAVGQEVHSQVVLPGSPAEVPDGIAADAGAANP